MILAAIVAEYNPFHAGHAHHIRETRAAGATHIAAIMSGNFTQRGTPAWAEKRARARSALLGGVDLVLELPLPYAMATAQRFAFGAAGLAEGLGCVDFLSFGSESGSLSLLQAAAKAVDEPAVEALLRSELAAGITFAKARQQAVTQLYGAAVGTLLGNPNDALGIEYIRQLGAIGSRIPAYAVPRRGAGHDATTPQSEMASASLLRARIRTDGITAVADFIPPDAFAAMQASLTDGTAPFSEENLSMAMFARLRQLSLDDLRRLPDLSEGLEHVLFHAIRSAVTLEEIFALAKSKRYPAARIRRLVMAAVLGVDGALCTLPPPYLRVLGCNEKGREILARAKKAATLPLSDSLATLRKASDTAHRFATLEAAATDWYTLGLPNSALRPCGYDFTADSVRLFSR